MRLLDRHDIQEMEPHCAGLRAVYCPSTGIVDYSAVTAALAADVTRLGGHVLTSSRVTAVHCSSSGTRVTITVCVAALAFCCVCCVGVSLSRSVCSVASLERDNYAVWCVVVLVLSRMAVTPGQLRPATWLAVRACTPTVLPA